MKGLSYPLKSSKRWKILPKTAWHTTSREWEKTSGNMKAVDGPPQNLSTRVSFPTSKDTTSAKYKDADRLRTSGHGITEIYETLKFVAERGGDPSDEDLLLESIAKLRRLAIYAYATAKQMDTEAHITAAKALQLPESLKHITEEDESGKRLTFDNELIERINKAKYDESILRAATCRPNSAFNKNSSSNFHKVMEPEPSAELPRKQSPKQCQQHS
ncbi:hypothetical protein K450DRAFT_247892 [Umbelopsis ramanniana AG]|uniref:Uncharacterized protein n=1 Tax=Umbelopsis ramanniana AG TaxID=1314678 RepID=A0AAD5HBP5_UMBRA|nr:uncharacterized protein K450DRAFT_247892 [Umbelopsis ramanniana AG]KAI8578237.1 hypothetical protein K450DRAFT_247892 [Umbelopsis ramanniana AG]